MTNRPWEVYLLSDVLFFWPLLKACMTLTLRWYYNNIADQVTCFSKLVFSYHEISGYNMFHNYLSLAEISLLWSNILFNNCKTWQNKILNCHDYHA